MRKSAKKDSRKVPLAAGMLTLAVGAAQAGDIPNEEARVDVIYENATFAGYG